MFGKQKTKDSNEKPENPNDKAQRIQKKESRANAPQSKDPFEQGYNKGMDDGKDKRKRTPHHIKQWLKLVMMPGKHVEQYVKGYHQGYDFAVKSKRIQQEREITGDAQYQKRLERRQEIRDQVKKAKTLEKNNEPDL